MIVNSFSNAAVRMSEPWENPNYYQVVCKDRNAHRSENRKFGHKIPFAETGAFVVLPVSGPILDSMRCVRAGGYVRDQLTSQGLS